MKFADSFAFRHTNPRNPLNPIEVKLNSCECLKENGWLDHIECVETRDSYECVITSPQ